VIKPIWRVDVRVWRPIVLSSGNHKTVTKTHTHKKPVIELTWCVDVCVWMAVVLSCGMQRTTALNNRVLTPALDVVALCGATQRSRCSV
jgi:hypothetical protein